MPIPSVAQPAMRPAAALLVCCALALLPGFSLAQEAGGGGGGEEVDYLEMGLTFIGGLALFLWALRELAHKLNEVGGDRLKRFLEKGSGDRVRGLLSGTAATVVLDSSSATIIFIIALVDAGLLKFAASLPVILGSNIGTTFSSQVFAWNAQAIAPLLLLTGLLMRILSKSDKVKTWAGVLFSLGLVLFALDTIGAAMEPLKEQEGVRDWLAQFENPLLGLFAGMVATIVLQSSSAVLGIIITMAGQNLIGLESGVAMMLGAEIGTCADTLVSTIGRSATAVRAGVFHLAFNIVSAAVGLLLVTQLEAFAKWSAGEVNHQIANAHVMFNVAGALAVLPFVGLIAALLTRLLPDRGEKDRNDKGDAEARDATADEARAGAA